MSTAATLESGIPLDNSIGAMMIGVIISAVLHGLCLLQAFYYFQRYKKDSYLLKLLVAVMVVLDATHLAMISHTVYHYTITHFADQDALKHITWTVVIEALPTGVNGAMVQTFYAYRVWKLSQGNYLLTGLILLLILCCAGCGTAWVVISMRMFTYRNLLRITPLTITINALSTTIDVLIATSLVYLLNSARTGFRKSDTMINKLIIFVVNTGILTTICATAALISLSLSPNTLIYATFYFCIGRLYLNSFLATLNARQSITEKIDNVDNMLMSMPRSVVSSQTTKQNISIRIDKTQESDSAARKHRDAHSPAPQLAYSNDGGHSDDEIVTKGSAL